MMNAATGALRSIGADGHEAIVIAHNDTANPHCHIIVNLIGDDGRLKKNWKEREKLSRFALEQEKKIHGEPVVKRREKNIHQSPSSISSTSTLASCSRRRIASKVPTLLQLLMWSYTVCPNRCGDNGKAFSVPIIFADILRTELQFSMPC